MSTDNTPETYYRRIIRITAEDSPNVRLARAQLDAGLEPTNEILVRGVLPWSVYKLRRMNWDEVKQRISLDAQFWEGAETLLYPPQWLDAAAAQDMALLSLRKREAKAIGCDPGEGSAETAIAVIDELGLIEMWARRTPDTASIADALISLGKRHNVPPSKWMLDTGGGGRQIAHMMRRQGYNVLTVGFGEGVISVPRQGMTPFSARLDLHEAKSAYKNRRAQMYGELRTLLDPSPGKPFALPARYNELRRQLAMIPLLYDGESKLFLPPKNPKEGGNPESPNFNRGKQKSLTEIIGCSPDQADALVISIHCMIHGNTVMQAGAVKRK